MHGFRCYSNICSVICLMQDVCKGTGACCVIGCCTLRHFHVAIVVNVVDYICEEYNNPPDFFLDVLSGSVGVTATTVTEEIALPNGEWQSVTARILFILLCSTDIDCKVLSSF